MIETLMNIWAWGFLVSLVIILVSLVVIYSSEKGITFVTIIFNITVSCVFWPLTFILIVYEMIKKRK